MHIMNNECLDIFNFISSTQVKEKQILFEYFFNRCKETNKLKCLLDYALNIEEENVFLSYLKSHNDTQSLTCRLLFLLHRGRYLEACELNKLLKDIPKLKFDNALTNASLLVRRYEKNIPAIMRQSYDHQPLQNVYKKTSIVTKFMNADMNKMFDVMNRKKDILLKEKNLSIGSSNSINLILPANNNRPKHPAEDDINYNDEKRRKLYDSPEKADNEIIGPMGHNVLDILHTPLIEKTVSSPSLVSNISSILKTKSSVKSRKRMLSMSEDEVQVSKTVIKFNLPADNSLTEQRIPADNTNMIKSDVQEHNSYNIGSSDLANQVVQPTQINLKEVLVDDYVMEASNSHLITEKNYKYEEKMEISDSVTITKENNKYEDQNLLTPQLITLSSDDEVEEQDYKKPCLTLLNENNNSDLSEDDYNIEPLSQHRVIENKQSIPVSLKNIDKTVNGHSVPVTVNIYSSSPENQDDSNNSDESQIETKISFSNSDTNSQDSDQVNKYLDDNDYGDNDDVDDDVIVLDSEDENEVDNVQSDTSSSIKSLNNSNESITSSDESDLETTRYGRFKSAQKSNSENSESEEDIVEHCVISSDEDEKINVEDNDDTCDEVTEKPNFEQRDIKYYDETEEDNSKQYDIKSNKENEEIYVLENEDDQITYSKVLESSRDIRYYEETKKGNLEQYDIKSNEEIYVLEEKDDLVMYSNVLESNIDISYAEAEEGNSKQYNKTSNEENEKIYVLDKKDDDLIYSNILESNTDVKYDETRDGKLEQYDIKSNEESEEIYVLEEKDDQVMYSNVLESNMNIKYYDETEGSKSKQYNIKSNEENENMYVLEKKDDQVMYSNVSEANTDIKYYDETEEDNSKQYDSNEQTEEIYVLEKNDDQVIYSNISESNTEIKYKTEENNSKQYDIKLNEENEGMYVANGKSSFIDKDIGTAVDQQIDDSAIKDHTNNEMCNTLNETSNQILVADINCSAITGIESSQLGSSDVDQSNQSTPFLFGDSYFGQQVLESKPMLLFGQLYSFENEQITVDLHINKPEIQAINTNSNEKVFTDKETADVELAEDIQDILELESLPDSEIDENVHKNPRSNALDDNQHSVSLDHSNSPTTIIPKNTDDVLISNETCRADINVETPTLPMSPEKDLCETDDILQNENNDEIDLQIDVNTTEIKSEKLSSDVVDDVLISNETCSVDINMETPSLPMSPEKDLCKTDDILQNKNDIEIHHQVDINTTEIKSEKLSCDVVDDVSISIETCNADVNIETQSIPLSPENNLCKTDDNLQNENNVEIDHQTEIINTMETKSEKLSCDAINDVSISNAVCSADVNVETLPLPVSSENKLCKTDDILQNENNVEIVNTIKIKSEKLPCGIVDDVSINNETCDADVNVEIQSVPMSPEKNLCKTDDMLQNENNIEIDHQRRDVINTIETKSEKLSRGVAGDDKSNEVSLISQNTGNVNTSSVSQQHSVKVPVSPLRSVSNEETLRRHTRAKSEEVLRKKQLLIEKGNKLENNIQENAQQAPRISERLSSKKRTNKSNVSYNIESADLNKSDRVEVSQIECVPSTSKSYVNKQIDEDITNKTKIRKAKSTLSPDTNVITTRSRARSESNLVQLDTSLNVFRPSITDINSRQTRISLPRKLSKSQQNLISTNRRSVRSKSLAPVEEKVTTQRKTVLTLERVPEEDNDNELKVDNSIKKRKSKFNFVPNKSKKIEENSASVIDVPCDTRVIKTPKRSKSVQPEPALTYSMVKMKPKRCSSNNSLQLKDKSSTGIDDLMDVLKKRLTSPVRTRKRSRSESVKPVENVNEVAKSDTSESAEMLSPIKGDNMKHTLFTPRMKRKQLFSLDSSVVDSDDLSRHSAQKTESVIQNNKSSVLKHRVKSLKAETETRASEHPLTSERRITRLQQSIMEKSLQSTSAVEMDNNESVSEPKREVKKTAKQKKNNK